MQPRITSPALGLPQATADLVHRRVSQVNGCAVWPGMHARPLKKAAEAGERMFTVAGWRDAPYFTDAERAVLALAEAATRMADRADPVPGEIFDGARKHYGEPALAALVVQVAVISAWNPAERHHRPGGRRMDRPVGGLNGVACRAARLRAGERRGPGPFTLARAVSVMPAVTRAVA